MVHPSPKCLPSPYSFPSRSLPTPTFHQKIKRRKKKGEPLQNPALIPAHLFHSSKQLCPQVPLWASKAFCRPGIAARAFCRPDMLVNLVLMAFCLWPPHLLFPLAAPLLFQIPFQSWPLCLFHRQSPSCLTCSWGPLPGQLLEQHLLRH